MSETIDPQLIVVRYDAEHADYVVKCPVCGYESRLMLGFSLLEAGFNGIESQDPDNLNRQECGHCEAKLRWDDVPAGPPYDTDDGAN